MSDFAFLHGGGQGGWVWAETIAALRAQRGDRPLRTLALDAPGCGAKRGRDTQGLAMADVARDLIADIEAAGLRDVILVGHSQAGQALPIMGRMRPDLFARLIYVTCSAPLPGQPVSAMLGKGLHGESDTEVGWPVDPATTPLAERYAIMFCNDMPEAQASAFLDRLGHDNWPMETYRESDWRYDGLDAVPASYVLCLRDLSLPPSWQERFAERLRVDRLIRLDAGHQAMNSRPHALAEIMWAEATP